MLPDFSQRAEPATLPELMDEPCSYEEFFACLVDLERVNRLTLAYRPTLQFLTDSLATADPSRPVRILDVGSGGGDMLRRIEAWSRRHGVPVELTGIDLNPHATRTARELISSRNDIEFLTGNAYTYQPSQPPDIILSSLLTHHLSSEEIVRFLAWMQRTARHGWFINDLARSERSHNLFGMLAKAMGWHRFVQHDGPVSIRRSFSEIDWLGFCEAANIPSTSVEIQRRFPSRLCVGHLR